MTSFEEISERERRFLIQTYDRYPVAIERGKGVFLYDLEGKRYLDFVAGLGVNALGHAHPRIVKVTREQAARVIHLSNLYYNEYQGRLAEKLCSLSGLQRAFFSNSGTEAIEGSIKLARLAGHKIGGESKTELVALQGSYHGRTFGSMSLTGQDKYRKGFEPLLGEVTFIQRNDVVALRAAVGDNTCAIVLEPIFGEGGILECSVEFLQECRAASDRHRAALIFDEIQCGLGRMGTIFAFQTFGVMPDIVAIAKPIAAGIPLGAFLAREEFASAISVGQHGTTFGGGPLACRVALEYLARIFAAGVEESHGNLCCRERSPWPGLHPRACARHPGTTHRRTSARRGFAVQQHSGYRLALPASISSSGEACGQGGPRAQEIIGEEATGGLNDLLSF